MNYTYEVTKIPNNLIVDLNKFVSRREYKRDADIIYKGHIPQSGFLLIDGCIELQFSKTKMIKIDDASIIGVRELMNSEPFKFKVSIRSNSLVYILDKSTVIELLECNNTELNQLISNELV